MKTVTFLIGTFTFTFSGPNWASIIAQLNRVQNLNCLVREVRMIGTEADEQEAAKLDAFLDKCYHDEATRRDFETLSINLSMATLRTLSVTEA